MAQYGLDWSPIVNVLGRLQQNRQHADDVALRREAMLANQSNMLAQRGMNERQFALEQQKFNALGQQQAATNALGWYNARKNSDVLTAQAEYYRARARGLDGSMAPQPTSAPQYGMREDGSIYEIGGGGGPSQIGGGDMGDAVGRPAIAPGQGFRSETQVLGAGSSAEMPPPSRSHNDYGLYGANPASIPGVVVTPKGVTDQAATRIAEGQRAVDATTTASDRDRAIRFMNTQQKWTYMHKQKPRAGYMYDELGREVPKGPMPQYAQLNEQRDKALKIVQRNIDDAEKTLLNSWNVTRTMAEGSESLGAAGRMLRPPVMDKLNQAFSKYKEGTLQMVYALSGKQTTNKEMDNFLEMYQPRAGESDDLIRAKTKRLKSMLSTLSASVKKGMVYEDAERAALSAAIGADNPQASGEMQNKDFSKMSTDDLLRSLNGR